MHLSAKKARARRARRGPVPAGSVVAGRPAQAGAQHLSGIDAQRVRFEDCRVGTLRLHGGSLSDVDLRGLEMRTVNGVGSLAGATVSSGQLSKLAPLLAQHLGLRVTDQDHAQNATTRSKRA